MKNRHNFEFSPKVLLAILTGVCAVLLTLSVAAKDVIKPLTTVVGYVVVPMQKGINVFGAWVGDRFDSMKTMDELKEENALLKEQVEDLQEENMRLADGEVELEELRTLVNLDKEYAKYNKVGARIISNGSGNWYEDFVIDKGSSDGIAVNMNVISGTGLVGIVTEVGRNYAKVKSLIADGSSVSAVSVNSGDTCIVKGNSDSMKQKGTIDVSYIDKDAEMKTGEHLITSHISSKYLPGLRIGMVSDITMDSSNLTQSAVVTPEVDFNHLSMVLVITDLKAIPEGVETAD